MNGFDLDRISARAVLLSAFVGLLGGLAGGHLIPEAVFQFRTALVGAVCVGVVAAVLAEPDPRQAALVAVLAEIARSLVLFVASGIWILVYGGQGPGFFLFYLLFGGGVALVVAVLSVAVAGLVGGGIAVGRRAVGR